MRASHSTSQRSSMRVGSWCTSRVMRNGRSIRERANRGLPPSCRSAASCNSARCRSMSTGHPEPSRLIADIGGTNARFALLDGERWRDERVLACADYPDLVAAVEAYLAKVGAASGPDRPRTAAMAIAGPITSDMIRMTNHVWHFSARDARARLHLQSLCFLNDFTALAMAVRHLPQTDLEPIGGGRAVAGAPIAVIGPGTGLGVSGVIPAGDRWIALQGEGGHATLPVMNEREMAVLRHLHQRFSHVSAERVLCGPGLVNLYEALCALDGIASAALTPAEITRRAGDGSCRVCFETVSIFCALLGTMA